MIDLDKLPDEGVRHFHYCTVMALQFYDTRQRRKVPFEPLEPGQVKLYTCGPTVYNDAHIGNFRTYMFEDLLRRTLKYLGYQVTQVMNLTDVDDKTIRGARQRGVSLSEYTAPFIKRFHEDRKLLRIEDAEVYPAATDHIPQMIALIEELVSRGIAYEAEGSVYYSVEKFPDYGKLSGKKLDQLKRGVRINADEYDEKDDFRDFALWKGWSEEDGDVWWESPWGRGRPGWHIECSAMSREHLGPDFDIHTGGVDNIFPHHENEIAQSVAATGSGFVRYWLHSAHLVVEGEKMSKSKGNFYTVGDLRERNYSLRAVRYLLMTTHYRQRMNLGEELVVSANAALERLDTLVSAAQAVGTERPGEVRSSIAESIQRLRAAFRSSLEDDLNTSETMASLFNFVGDIHRLREVAPLDSAESAAILEVWRECDTVTGFLFWDELDPKVVSLVRERMAAKASRDFAQADAIRSQLALQGVILKDAQNGTEVRWSSGEGSGSGFVRNS